jgi:protein tyrosine phosphatase (PTP) superfamily phosphohydrolase (DUF442 family)
MSSVRWINNELAIADQVPLSQLSTLLEEGFRSVLNLRSPQEITFLDAEQQQIEALGLGYFNAPVQAESIIALNEKTLGPVLQHVGQLPKPALIHCSSGVRAITIVWLYLLIKRGVSLEQAFLQVERQNLLAIPVYF